MPERLLFADSASAADALTFASRAARLTDDAVRLQASSGVMAMTAAVLAPRGLGDATPTVLGMRTLAVDPELICDIVVPASALRIAADALHALLLPETGLAPAWAGIAPPRGGWVESGAVEASALDTVASAGIAEVTAALPTDAGEDVLRGVRVGVWGPGAPELGDLPRGVAFAASALGFLQGAESARVLTSGLWTRIALRRGHVLVRRPLVSGLTPVRATGARG